jgi:hypothetical protein
MPPDGCFSGMQIPQECGKLPLMRETPNPESAASFI